MRRYPPLRSVEEAPDVLEGGHLWLLEYVTGPVLGFSMDDSGLLTFGLDGEPFESTPPSLRQSVNHVRDSIDRDSLRAGVEDVSDFVFYGIATRYEGIDYDWTALSPFLGIDIWAGSEGRFVSPDVSERVFDAIGLSPVPAFRKEVPTREFDPQRVDFPHSHWRDGQAAGIIVRNKAGGRAVLENPSTDSMSPSSEDASSTIDEAVDRTLRTELGRLNGTVHTIDVGIIEERVFERIARTRYTDLQDRLEADEADIRRIVGSTVRGEIEEHH